MAVLTIVKYGGISVADAEESVGERPRGREKRHEAFLRRIKADTKWGGRKKYKRKKRR